MNKKQSQTLKAIFTLPIRSDIKWTDIESLFKALGGQITQGRGSRVRVSLNGIKAVFHEPHPQKETDKGAVKAVKEFLLNAGIEPEDNLIAIGSGGPFAQSAAKALLQNPDANITTIAYNTGFNDPSYFGRVFKKEFNMTPKEWQEKEVSM